MARLLDKLKRYVADRRVHDVAPPEPCVPTGLSRTLQTVRPLPGQGPRAGAPLRGSVDSPNDRDQVFYRPEERTEELLALTDDTPGDPADDGIDPYNTGAFRTGGIWRRD